MNMISFLLTFTAISALLFAYYFLFLRKEKQFQGNRFFLLAILPISAILPFLEFPFFQAKEISPVIGSTLETITITSEQINTWAYGYDSMISILYFCISLGFLSFFLFRMIKLVLFIRKSPNKEQIAGATLVFGDAKVSPASFGPYIFWNKEDEYDESQKSQILTHELCHIRQLHSLDILFLEFWKIIAWFNPLIYLINRELKIIHEYQADHAASFQDTPHTYIELLLSQTLGQSLQLSHSFYQLPIKNRIMMLMHKPDIRWTRIKYAMIVPFACTLFIACTSEFEKDSNEVLVENTVVEGKEDRDYLDYMKKEGDASLEVPKPINLHEIKKMIGYPQICRDAGIQGQVMLRILVDKSGNYKSHEVLAEGHKILREAVEKHIDKLNFNPVRKDNKPVELYVNIPFNFILLD